MKHVLMVEDDPHNAVVFHKILERRAVVLPVDDDWRLEVDRARGVLEEPAVASVGSVDDEEERAVAAAVWEVLSHPGAQPAAGRGATGTTSARAAL